MTRTAVLATLGDWITEAEATIARTVQGPNHPHLLKGDPLFSGPANVAAHARRNALIEARDLVATAAFLTDGGYEPGPG